MGQTPGKKAQGCNLPSELCWLRTAQTHALDAFTSTIHCLSGPEKCNKGAGENSLLSVVNASSACLFHKNVAFVDVGELSGAEIRL